MGRLLAGSPVPEPVDELKTLAIVRSICERAKGMEELRMPTAKAGAITEERRVCCPG